MPAVDSSSDAATRRIVVGVDSSLSARVALEHAAGRAGTDGCLLITHVVGPLPEVIARTVGDLDDGRHDRVIAVHAFHPAADWLGAPYYQRALDAYQAHGRELLASLEDEHHPAVELVTSLLEGPAARAIVAAADARDADEIVVGSRGLGPVRGVLGSVSHAVLHEADRPVVVIPADAAARDDERGGA